MTLDGLAMKLMLKTDITEAQRRLGLKRLSRIGDRLVAKSCPEMNEEADYEPPEIDLDLLVDDGCDLYE